MSVVGSGGVRWRCCACVAFCCAAFAQAFGSAFAIACQPVDSQSEKIVEEDGTGNVL